MESQSVWERIREKFMPGFLDPMERISEVLFGLIMVLTFTGSLSAAEAGEGEVRTMLFGALGCNLAWGIIDAYMYLMACFAERGKGLLLLREVRGTKDPGTAHRIIADAMPPVLSSLLSQTETEAFRQKLHQLPDPPTRARLAKQDWLGALAVFALVFFSTLPVVIPFTFLREIRLAMRVSNAIAIVMLFLTGYAFGRESGLHPWRTGLVMVLIGAAMVGITMALGG